MALYQRIFFKCKEHSTIISFIAILLFGAFLFQHAFADMFSTALDGNWNDGTTWGRGSVDYPTPTDDVTITHHVTLTSDQSIHTVGIASGGTLDLNGHTLTVTGNFINEGTFVASGGTVNLSGTNQTISGSATFYNLTKTVSSPDTLFFNPGTQTITGTLSLGGAADNLLSIRQPSVTPPVFSRKWGTQTSDDDSPRPSGVAVDSSGNIYVADQSENRVFKLNSSGVVTSIFSNPDSPMNSPVAIALDPSNNMYIVDSDNNRILKLAPDGSQLASFTVSGPSFGNPNDVALDSSGNIYVSDYANSRIVELNPTGSVLATFTDTGTPIGRPDGVALDTSGKIYVSDPGNNRIVKLASDDSELASFNYTDFANPRGLTVDSSGKIYVVDNDSREVFKLASNGSVLGTFDNGDSPFFNPYRIARDSSGNIYVSDADHSRVAKLASDGTPIHSFGALYTSASSGTFSNPQSISTDSSGNVYVADCGESGATNRIQEFDSSGTFVAATPSPGSDDYEQVWCPSGQAVDSSGNLYVTDNFHDRIIKYDSSKNFVTAWGSEGSAEGQFSSPGGIVIDSSGNIYVEDASNYRIQKFDKDGNFISTWGWGVQDGTEAFQICTSSCQYGLSGHGTGEFTDSRGPVNLAVDSHDNIYVAEGYNNRIEKFDKDGNFISAWGWGVSDGADQLEVCTSGCRAGSEGLGEGKLDMPVGISIDSSNTVYVGSIDTSVTVQMFSTDGAYLGKVGLYGSGDGDFTGPWGVAADSGRNAYVLDSSLYRINKFIPLSGYSLNPQGSVSVSFLSVSGATNAATSPIVCTNGCVDGGGNTNWTFPATVTAGASAPAGNGPVFSGSASALPGYVAPRKQIVYPDGKIVYLDSTSTPAVTQPATEPTSATDFVFTHDLSANVITDDVEALQKYFNTHGFILATTGPGSPGNETNKFGALTYAALIKFQTANHIRPISGYFGPITRGVINKH